MSGPPGRPGTGLSGDAEKGESSRAGRALERAGESSVQLRPNGPTGETVKTGHTGKHIAREEASFAAFLDSEAAPVPLSSTDPEEALHLADSRPASSRVVGAASVAEQEAQDGADVVALLSDNDSLEPVFSRANEPVSRVDMAGLRRALFGEEADRGTTLAWDNVLNFIPEHLQADSRGVSPGDGSMDAGEAWQAWIGQWSRVLTSYQDEVWGDLGRLVEEARTDVQRMEESRPDVTPPEPKALLRLRAILGHLRGAPP